MFRSGPFTLAGNRQASAVDDEMKACAPWNAPKPEVEVLATTGQRRVIRRPKVESHQHEERREKALCLTEREMDEKTQRQGGLDREVRVLPLRASRARSVRFPGGDGRRGQPDGDVASTDQCAIIGGPVLDVVLCLVRGMDSRLHPSSLVCSLATSLRIRAPTPRFGSGASGSVRSTRGGCGAAAVGWETPSISTRCSSRSRVADSICGARSTRTVTSWTSSCHRTGIGEQPSDSFGRF